MCRTRDSLKDGEVGVREAAISDAAAIRAIAESSGIDAWTVDQYGQEIQSKTSIVLIAVNYEAIVGFILGRIIPGAVYTAEGEIYNIAVTDKARGRGIGRLLLSRAIERFTSGACGCLWLEVRSSNLPALQFYENNGFMRSAVRRNFYANPVEDAIVMRLPLSENALTGPE